MGKEITFKEWLTQNKRYWSLLAGFGAFVAATTSFVPAPPVIGDGFKAIRALGLLVATLTIALQIAVAYRFNKRRHLTVWCIILGMSLLLAITSFVYYERAFPVCTCEYRGRLLL